MTKKMKTLLCVILSVFTTISIYAQSIEISRYEGKMKPHKTLHEISPLLHADDIGTGYYEYYESENGRILHGQYKYIHESQFLNIIGTLSKKQIIAEGKFSDGKLEGPWSIYEYFPETKNTGNHFTFVCHQGKFSGPVSIVHSEIMYSYEFTAEIYDELFKDKFRFYAYPTGIIVPEGEWPTCTLVGQFDENGMATGKWISTGTDLDLPETYTLIFEGGLLRKLSIFDESVGESRVTYHNTGKLKYLGDQEYLLRYDGELIDDVVGIGSGAPSSCRSPFGTIENCIVQMGNNIPGDLDDVFKDLAKYLRFKCPFRSIGGSRSGSWYWNEYALMDELEKEYINNYKESVKDSVFRGGHGYDFEAKEVLDRIVQELSQTIDAKVKGEVVYDLYVNAEGGLDSLKNIRVVDCKKAQLVQEIMERELPARALESVKFSPHKVYVPKPKNSYPVSPKLMGRVPNWEPMATPVKIPVKYKTQYSSYFKN